MEEVVLTRLIDSMHFIPGGWSTLTISRERLGVELLVRGMGREMCELA